MATKGMTQSGAGEAGRAIPVEVTTNAITLKAKELDRRFREFASATLREKEEMIKGLVDYVTQNATKEVLSQVLELNGNLAFNGVLNDAARQAAQTPVSTRIGTRVDWGKDYVVAAIDKDGTFLGYAATAGKEGNAHYTISKTLAAMLLDAAGRNTNIAGPGDNIEYLEKLGLKVGVNIFLGGIAPKQIGNRTVYLAGGSCALNKKLVVDILKEDPNPDDIYVLAAVSETIMPEITAETLSGKSFDDSNPYKSPTLEEVYSVFGRELTKTERKTLIDLYS